MIHNTIIGSGGGSTSGSGPKICNCDVIQLLRNPSDLQTLYAGLTATSDTHNNGIELNAGIFDETYDEIHIDLSVLSTYGVNLYDGKLIFRKVMMPSTGSSTGLPMWTCYFTIQQFTNSTVIDENRLNIWTGWLSFIHKHLT